MHVVVVDTNVLDDRTIDQASLTL